MGFAGFLLGFFMGKQKVSLFSKCQNSLDSQVYGLKVANRHWLAFVKKVKNVLTIVAAKLGCELHVEVGLH